MGVVCHAKSGPSKTWRFWQPKVVPGTSFCQSPSAKTSPTLEYSVIGFLGLVLACPIKVGPILAACKNQSYHSPIAIETLGVKEKWSLSFLKELGHGVREARVSLPTREKEGLGRGRA